MIRAEVGWALRACHEDYTVLASGGRVPGLAGVFARLPSDAPSAGTRVTFGGVREDRFEVVLQEWSHDIDADGRPIPLSRYFSVPAGALSAGRVDYRSLYAALRGTETPQDGKALLIALPAEPAEERSALVERFGFGRTAGAASLLLDGPVTVTHAGGLCLEERLAFADAVAALLPYGMRAGLVVSTEDGGEGLSFAARCGPGAAELDWRDAAPPGGHAYLERLAGLPLAKAADHLAEQVAPLAGLDTAAAIGILDELDMPGAVLRAVREGRLSYDEVHRLFASGRFRELPSAEDRQYLFNELVARGDVDDLMVVEPLWDEVGGDFEALVKAARAKLWQLEPELETVRYLWSAERLGFADAFLARLVSCPDPEKSLEGAPGGEAAVARLVRTRSKEEYTLAFSALADNGPVLYELLHQLAGEPGKSLEEWYERLKRCVPADLLVPFFRVLRGDGASVDANALARVVARGPGCLKTLLRTAAATGRLTGVLPAFAVLLTGGTVPERDFWAAEMTELEPVHAGDQGVVDGLLLLLDRPPRHLENAAAGDWARYQEAFERLCALPDVAAPVIARLTVHLNTWSWQTDPRWVAAVLGLVSAREDVLELARVVLVGRAVEPALIEDEQYAAWRRRVLSRLPQLVAEEVPLTLTCLRPEADPVLVARLCAEAIDRRVPLEEVVEHLTRSRWQLDGDRAVRLLNGVRDAFAPLGWSRREAEEFALAFGRAIVLTARPALVAEIREHAARETLLEIEYQYQLLQNVMMDPLDDEVLYLSDHTRAELEELAAWVTSLARSGRSRTWFG